MSSHRREGKDHPPAGYVSTLRLVVDDEWKYDLTSCEKASKDDFQHLCKRMVEDKYKFCPGIEVLCKEKINASCLNITFHRVDSIKGPLYLKVPRNEV